MIVKRGVRRKPVMGALIVITFIVASSLPIVSLSNGTNGTFNNGLALTDLTNYTASSSTPISVRVLSTFSATISPTNPVIDVGQSVTFNVSTNQSTFTYTYDWFLNGKSVGSGNTYTLISTPSEAGKNSLYVDVTNGSNQVQSNTATVTVNTVPVVTISPGSEKASVGKNIMFQSNVTGGTGPFTYKWYLNGTRVNDAGRYYNFTPTGNTTYYVYLIVTDNGTSSYTPVITSQSSTSVITAIQETFLVIFQESGLPAGTKWYVNLTSGQVRSSVSNTITFSVPNGSYTFTVSSGNKIYAPSPSYDSFTVNGYNQSFIIEFSPLLYSVIFSESGLPSKSIWYANISGQTSLSSNTSTIVAKLHNGSYTFTVSTSNKEFYPSPYSGSVQVNGHLITLSIDFSLKLYPVEFTESGLPSNTEWFLTTTGSSNITGYNGSGSSFSPTISINLPNGTYNFVIKSGVQTYGPYPGTGTFNVSGNAISEAVAFLRLYQITFVESGLPLPSTDVRWFINISDPQSFNSSTDTITFWEPNQTYSFSVSSSDKWYVPSSSTQSGSFTVSGNSVTGPQISFNELLNVTFTQQKLPIGNHWYLNVTPYGASQPQSYSSTNSTISFTEINNSYNYSVSSGNKLYRPIPFQGEFIPNQTTFPISLTFKLVTYQVRFTESGLTNGTFWSITINNNTRISTNASIVFILNNGSFEYSIQSLAGFITNEYSGNVSVNGSSLLEPVNWTIVTYDINITQSGIAIGKHWSVTLQGKSFNGIPVSATLNTTESSVTFHEPNGSYNYTIHAPFGYTGSHVTGKITINGHSEAVAASLVPPNFTLIGIIGVVIVGLLAVALAIMIRRENRSLFVRDARYLRKGKYLKYKK